MNPTTHRFCAWTGVPFIVLFTIAMIFIAHMVPPLPPSWTGAQVLDFYRTHSLAIRAATAIMMMGTAFGFTWSASVAVWTARAEGAMPVLSFGQLVCAAWSFGGVYNAIVDFSSAAFRSDRPEQIVFSLNDHGWYWIVMPGSCAELQCILIGLAILFDKRKDPIFPRWVGYFNIWAGLLQIPGAMMPFFKVGPFAWDGLFAFWMPLVVFSLWIYVDTWAVLRAIRREIAASALAASVAA